MVLTEIRSKKLSCDHQRLWICQITPLEFEGTLWDGSNNISRILREQFKLGQAHQSLWHWNIGFNKDQYLDLFYLPCTPLHLVISSAIIVWISTFMLMIRNFIYHLSHVIQYLDRPPYHRLRPASRNFKTWMTNNWLKLNKDKTEISIITASETTSRQEDIVINIGKNRKYLDNPTTEKMMNSAMTSRLDYCKSLLYGINGYSSKNSFSRQWGLNTCWYMCPLIICTEQVQL